MQDHLAKNIESIRDDAKDNIQVILTSHSTHIAAKLNLENTVIIFNDRNQDKLDSHYILSNLDTKKESRTIQYLSNYLDATKSRMFFARKIILVEGISEQLIVPKLFEQYFGDTPEKFGCNVINVNGVAFSHFLKIIRNGFFVKCLVLTDSDIGTKTQDRADNLKNNFDQPELIKVEITNETTFEKELITANSTGSGKQILLKALSFTKPKSPIIVEAIRNNRIDVNALFAEIEKYKAEFAFNLLTELSQNIQNFVIPPYIQRGFKFLDLRVIKNGPTKMQT